MLILDTNKMDKQMKYHILHQIVTLLDPVHPYNPTSTQRQAYNMKPSDENLLGETAPMAYKTGICIQGEKSCCIPRR